MTLYQQNDVREYVHTELENKIDGESYEELISKYSHEQAKLTDLLNKALKRYTNCNVSVYRQNRRSKYNLLTDVCDEICLKISLDKTLQNIEIGRAHV